MLTEQLLKYAFGNSSPKNIENLSSLGYPTLKIGKCVSCILIGWLIRLIAIKKTIRCKTITVCDVKDFSFYGEQHK
jgi:hypothetical protein